VPNAGTFGGYGLVRKTVDVRPLAGSTFESWVLVPAAGLYLIWLHGHGGGTLLHEGWRMDLLLVGTGVVSFLPLWAFVNAAPRVTLTTLGFLQYIAPRRCSARGSPGNNAWHWGVSAPVGALHDHVTGVHLLHGLTAAVPLAALLVATGAITLRRTAWLALLGLLLTLASAQLVSIHGPEHARVAVQVGVRVAWFGAPLPYARAVVDANGGLATTPTILRAYAFADALFWVCAAVILGSILSVLSRLSTPRVRRPLPRRVA
jgi:hypothetical protein